MSFLYFLETHILTQAPSSRVLFLKLLVLWYNTEQIDSSTAISQVNNNLKAKVLCQ